MKANKDGNTDSFCLGDELWKTFPTMAHVEESIKNSQYKINKGWIDFWEGEVSRYCMNNDVTPQELIELHKKSKQNESK